MSEQNCPQAPKASSKVTTGWLVKRDFNALPNRGEQMDILHKLSKLEKKKTLVHRVPGVMSVIPRNTHQAIPGQTDTSSLPSNTQMEIEPSHPTPMPLHAVFLLPNEVPCLQDWTLQFPLHIATSAEMQSPRGGYSRKYKANAAKKMQMTAFRNRTVGK